MREDHAEEDGIYQIEQILDERKVITNGSVSGREYLIKWRGFKVGESTWEPERNILNKSFVNFYKCEKLEAELRATPEAKIPNSVTSVVAEALRRGTDELEKELIQMKAQEETPGSKQRVCPFCEAEFRDGFALVGHMKIHTSERNYEAIREAARLIHVDWYKS
uniref:Chromo domain-containing protein n=1 Tax=Cyclophora tenuis TaxID=216820 RepID=A0A7S1D176_CYCTE